MYAAALGNVKCVKKLISKGAALHTADKFGDASWTFAANAGSVDVLKYLIEDHGIDKHSINRHGSSMLYFAVRSGNIETARFLLNQEVTVTTCLPLKCRVRRCDGCQVDLS